MITNPIPSTTRLASSGSRKPRGIFLMDQAAFDLIYDGSHHRAINEMVDLIAPLQTKESVARNPSVLKNVEFIFSGWGMPRVDHEFLKNSPQLKVIFYGSGAIGYFATEEMWNREIVVTSSIQANSIPVAEYTLATILFSLKHGWSLARRSREARTFVPRNDAPGAYKSTVGLVSLGEVARLVIKMLKPFDLNILAFDPYVSDKAAADLGVKRVRLQELFELSDVVSIHTPVLPETRRMISGKLIDSMKIGATLINTSRGEIIIQDEMIEVLSNRPDLQAVLDVCDPEPPVKDSPLFILPNVVLTPHIAGSVGAECKRMGLYMVEELRRYLKGERLLHQIKPEGSLHISNRPVTIFVNPQPTSPKINVGAL